MSELKPLGSGDSYNFENCEELDSQGRYLCRLRHGRKLLKIMQNKLKVPKTFTGILVMRTVISLSAPSRNLSIVPLQYASLLCSRDECKKPLYLIFYYGIMQGSENFNNSCILIIEALNESLKATFFHFRFLLWLLQIQILNVEF